LPRSVGQNGQSPFEPASLDLEYQRVGAEELQAELNLEPQVLEATYRWLAERARQLDPLPHLYDLRRLQPRDQREAERDAARRSLDLYDAAEIVRRGYRELTGPEHVQLWERSLEEDNFTPQELLDMVAAIAAAAGATLTLDVACLLAAQESRNQGNGRRKGLASVLQQLARRPEHGSVVFTKPQLAGP
jgi:hypothetical protein